MALPNALFFIQRAIRQIQEETGRAPDEIKLGSLFDGSGTMPLAAEMCGARAVWASEVEPYPIAVTRTHLPYMKHIGSVTEIRGGEIEPVDIITFGSPCQDLSIAGKRAGLEGARSGLFMEAVRIIREMRQATDGRYPRFAIWENVPGALSSNGGKDFETVLNEMLRLARPGEFIRQRGRWRKAENYGALAYRIVDAQYWGVPQRRRRIYLVTDFGGESAGVVTFERKGTAWDFEPRIPSPGFAGGAGLPDLLLNAINGMIEWWKNNSGGTVVP
jgi:DNA (cytosine-5)-methyltransferase 1